MNENETFLFAMGQKIRISRTLKGYSQEFLAEKAEIDKSYISNIECGKANPSIIYLKQIANALECDLIDLLKFTI